MKKAILFALAILTAGLAHSAGPYWDVKASTTQANSAVLNYPVLFKGPQPFITLAAYTASTTTSSGNAAKIQSAIDRLYAVGGGTLWVDGGIYQTTSAIKIRDNVNIVCPSWGSGFKIANGTDIDILVNYNYPSSGGADNAGIYGCTLDGNKAANTNAGSLVMYGTNNFRLINNRILGGDGTIPLLRASDRAIIERNWITDSATDGITVYDGSDYNLIKDNIVYNAAGFGILVQGKEVDGQTVSTGNQVIGNECYENTFDGITLFDGVNNTIVANNVSHDNDGKGLNIYSETTVSLTTSAANVNILVEGNQFYNNDADEGVKVWDNGCTGCGAQEVTITNNQMFDTQSPKTQGYGIALQNQADLIFVYNNKLRNNLTAGLLLGGGVNPNGQIYSNQGYVTHYGGATSVADGATVGHGLATTPERCVATATQSRDHVTITAKGATTFTVNISSGTAVGTSPQTIYWECWAPLNP